MKERPNVDFVGCMPHECNESGKEDKPDVLSSHLVRKSIESASNKYAPISALHSDTHYKAQLPQNTPTPNHVSVSLPSQSNLIPQPADNTQNLSLQRAPTSREAQMTETTGTQDHISAPSLVRPSHYRSRSSEMSLHRPSSSRSGDSRASKQKKSSARSATSKYRNIQDWSAGVKPTSPSSITPLAPVEIDLVDPPRPPKPGFEWVWFPEGYWAEREIRGVMPKDVPVKQKWWNKSFDLKSFPADKSTSEDKIMSGNKTTSYEIPEIRIGSISPESTTNASRSTTKTSRQESLNSSESSNRLGLYCRAKKNIQTRLCIKEKKNAAHLLRQDWRPQFAASASFEGLGGVTSRTTTVLNGTTRYLNIFQHRRYRLNTGLSQSPSRSSNDDRSRRRFGLAPWHRRQSIDSVLSASSSVHRLLMGKTPIGTPNLGMSYIGPDGKSYPKVEISGADPHQPTFLPSEATRIATPPMCTDSSEPRGMFFELNAPDETGHQGYSSRPEPFTVDSQLKISSPEREWWEADTQHRNMGNKSTHMPAKSPSTVWMAPTQFELNLPEHLTNSPLCPKNPKHPSGGTGLCVYHGRSVDLGLQQLYRTSTDESGVGMTIDSEKTR